MGGGRNAVGGVRMAAAGSRCCVRRFRKLGHYLNVIALRSFRKICGVSVQQGGVSCAAFESQDQERMSMWRRVATVLK